MSMVDSWAALPIAERLRVLRRARHLLAARTDALCTAIAPALARTSADTLVAEVLPLLAACRFLEREAERILRVRRLGRRGRPIWLTGIDGEVHRVALGRVLVIGPGNYPLFLPGVQALQGLAAGNAVIWKPGLGGKPVAEIFAAAMAEAGLPQGLLRVTDESVDAADQEIAAGVDKVFFTGSAAGGRAVMRSLAETLTPCVAELSGCDAVVVLPSAEMDRAVQALVFGMRLNGSATCMAPRRVIVVGSKRALEARLLAAIRNVAGIKLSARTRASLVELLVDAEYAGALISGDVEEMQRPIVLTNVKPTMKIAKADIFAPLLMLMQADDTAEATRMNEACPLALTVSILGDEREARALASRMTAGTVLINDLIVPTADPRVPFGGRRSSGFGVTRGAEGLFEMTAVKVISVRRDKSTRHLQPTGETHAGLFEGAIRASHAGPWAERWRGVRQAIAAGWKLR